jgi:hypothetical protein
VLEAHLHAEHVTVRRIELELVVIPKPVEFRTLGQSPDWRQRLGRQRGGQCEKTASRQHLLRWWHTACNGRSVEQSVHRPEVFKAGEPLPVRRRDPVIEAVAHVMDGLIPIGRFRFGLDSVLGLIPGLGDVIGAAIGMIIVMRAVQAGIPKIAIARMMTNIAIDCLVGAVPLLGDAFDFVFKSNRMNMQIYEQSWNTAGRRQATGSSSCCCLGRSPGWSG